MDETQRTLNGGSRCGSTLLCCAGVPSITSDGSGALCLQPVDPSICSPLARARQRASDTRSGSHPSRLSASEDLRSWPSGDTTPRSCCESPARQSRLLGRWPSSPTSVGVEGRINLSHVYQERAADLSHGLFRLNTGNPIGKLTVRHESTVSDALFLPLGASSIEAPFDYLLRVDDNGTLRSGRPCQPDLSCRYSTSQMPEGSFARQIRRMTICSLGPRVSGRWRTGSSGTAGLPRRRSRR